MKNVKRLCTLILSFFVLVSLFSCSNEQYTSRESWSDNIEQDVIIDGENSEDSINEEILNQIISEEVYIKEILVIEDKITELLIQEDKIKEVISCTTIYVPQENINEFSEHGQMNRVFGNNIDLGPLLTKVAIGTGVIITLAIMSVVGLEGAVGSIVAAAAPAALKGAAIGTLFGGFTGATTGAADVIDESGRTSAIIGFSVAVVGFVIATISTVLAIPSGGSTAANVAFGVKLAIAGISLASASYAGYNMVKTLTTTDTNSIDWSNVDWNKVGVSAAEQAINTSADGYMWGSVIGAVEGGLEGYESYEKYGTPYSKYKARLDRTPVDGERGHWTGERGESDFVLDEPITCKNGTVVDRISYKNGVPDFSDYAIRQVTISNMTDNRTSNFRQADELLAEYWTKIKFTGQKWSARDVSNYRTLNGLTWHEMNNMKTMQLVPTEINATWGHLGGVSEYGWMVGKHGGNNFD